MFRTHNKRGLDRFVNIRNLKKGGEGKLTLTKDQLVLIEKTRYLSAGEKIELLLVSIGHHLTSEIFQKIRYDKGVKNNSHPVKDDIEKLKSLFDELPFPYFIDSKLSIKKNGEKEKFTWFQVSINQKVDHFMKNYKNDMTEFEEGVLYGFPLSAIRAFAGLINSKTYKSNIKTYYLAGVTSADFQREEMNYYNEIWKNVKGISYEIVHQAEVEYKKSEGKNEKN